MGMQRVAVVCSAVLFAYGNGLAADSAMKCEAGKLKASSKYAACRLKADATAVIKGIGPYYGKCVSKFASTWDKIELKAGSGVCPTEGDEAELQSNIAADTAAIAASLSADRFEDTGLGTVIDHRTGLEWQKTDDAGGLIDKDNAYTWTGDGAMGLPPNGTAFTTFLVALNAPSGSGAVSPEGPTTTGCYAGHCDWRMPVIEELTTIIDCSFGDPCIDQSVFGATTVSSAYWSASTVDGPPIFAWGLTLDDGLAVPGSKDLAIQVRAVRGGS